MFINFVLTRYEVAPVEDESGESGESEEEEETPAPVEEEKKTEEGETEPAAVG